MSRASPLRMPSPPGHDGSPMSAAHTETASLSPECAVALRPGYEDLHAECRQTEDVPLPFATRLLLVCRCTCLCHGYNRQGSTQVAHSSPASQQPLLERDAQGVWSFDL